MLAGDGRKVVMDQAVLDHWMLETGKLKSDIESRSACLDYAIETLLYPTERWDQDTQSRYLKKFQKVGSSTVCDRNTQKKAENRNTELKTTGIAPVV